VKFSEELQEKINLLFKNNEELRTKLLEGDADSIRQIGSLSQKRIDPEDVVEAYESNSDEAKEYLYKKAKKMIALQELYKELCLEYCKARKKERDIER